MTQDDATADFNGRRRFLMGLGAASLIGGAGLALPAAPAFAGGDPKRLSFVNLHTGETLSATFWTGEGYRPEALAKLDLILRDWRTDEVTEIDPRLFDLLYAVARKLDSEAPFGIVSGYRSPATNAKLASASNGVAKKSLHMRGMAIDLRLADRELAALRDSAWKLQRGGVGYYPKSDFVHLDTGRPRHWGW